MKLAVYCGSREGNDPVFADATRALGRYLAAEGVDVVFGGGHVGLMGILADAVLAGGGRVYGVIPEALRDRELAHSQLTELHVVADMHQRKARMAELADGFLALPGGIGTLEELFEAWTGPARLSPQAVWCLRRQRLLRTAVCHGPDHAALRLPGPGISGHGDSRAHAGGGGPPVPAVHATPGEVALSRVTPAVPCAGLPVSRAAGFPA